MSRSAFATIAAVVLGVALTPPAATAQSDVPCSISWAPGSGIPGIDNTIYVTERWKQPGVGERLVCAGDFQHAGTVTAKNLAVFDPATGAWFALGNGVDGGVRAVIGLPTGELVLGG